MSETLSQADLDAVAALNDEALKAQFFTPDFVYMDLGLFKDIPLGCVYADQIVRRQDRERFATIQQAILGFALNYQNRSDESVNAYLSVVGYQDTDITQIVADIALHDKIFLMAPSGQFLNLLIRHTLLNRNHSQPANKFIKRKLDASNYVLEPMDVTYRINTYPLTLSRGIMVKLAETLGDSLGVNIVFMNKDPGLFDEQDWQTWMDKIQCFYLDSLGRFMDSPMTANTQVNMGFVGKHLYARKRFQSHRQAMIKARDFDQQIQRITAHMDLFSEFKWLTNTDLRLVDDPTQAAQPSADEVTP